MDLHDILLQILEEQKQIKERLERIERWFRNAFIFFFDSLSASNDHWSIEPFVCKSMRRISRQ